MSINYYRDLLTGVSFYYIICKDLQHKVNDCNDERIWTTDLFAKEPQMVVESYNRKELESPQQYAETYNGRWYDGYHLWIHLLRCYRQVLLWHLLMAETVFTVTSIAFLVLLGYSVQQLSETY